MRERFDLEPRQLPDYRGLKGDPSDNLPGIPGVGEKTAIKLVQAAGSLDALLANPKLAGTPKLEALVREHGEQARVCRDVSIVKRDLPLSARLGGVAAHAAVERRALRALPRARVQVAAGETRSRPKTAAAAPTDEPLRGNYTSYVAATDPPDFARLEAQLRAAAERRASRSRCAATRSG